MSTSSTTAPAPAPAPAPVRPDPSIMAADTNDFDEIAKGNTALDLRTKSNTSKGGALAFSELKGGQHQQQNQDYQHDELPVGGRRRRQNSKKKSQHKKKHGGSKKHQNKSKKHQNKNKRQRGGK